MARCAPKKECKGKHPPGHTIEIGVKNVPAEIFHLSEGCTKEKKCFNCNQFGHLWKHCKFLRQNAASAPAEEQGDFMFVITPKEDCCTSKC